MARPTKQGLDYFPFDVDFFDDPKIEGIEIKFGGDGVWVLLQFLSLVYREGYKFKIDPDFLESASFKRFGCKISPERIADIISEACRRGFFDEKIYNDYKILTSAGIQRRYLAATRSTKRKAEIEDNLCLIPEEIRRKSGGNPEETPVSSEETPVSSEETPTKAELMPQRKEKKSKVNNNNTPLTPLTGEEEEEGEELCDFDEKTILSGDPLISEIVDAWNKVFPKEHPQHFSGTIGELNTVFLENLRRTRKEYSDAKTFATVFEEIRASPDLTIPLHSAVKLENVKIFLTKNYNKTHGLTGRAISGSDEIRANRFNGSYSNPDNYSYESVEN